MNSTQPLKLHRSKGEKEEKIKELIESSAKLKLENKELVTLQGKEQACLNEKEEKIRELMQQSSKLKHENKELLNSKAKELAYIHETEGRVKELLENILKLKLENSELTNSKAKEISALNGKINELKKERDYLLHSKSKPSSNPDQIDKFSQERLIIEQENKNLKEPLLISRQNFENLESNTIDLQEKFFKQCQAYDALSLKNREVLEIPKKKKSSKSKSIGCSKSLIRSKASSPLLEKCLKSRYLDQPKPLKIEKSKMNININPSVNSKQVLEAQIAETERLIKIIEDTNAEKEVLLDENQIIILNYESRMKNLQCHLEKSHEERDNLAVKVIEIQSNSKKTNEEVRVLNGLISELNILKSKQENEIEFAMLKN